MTVAMNKAILVLTLIIALAVPVFAQEFPPVPADHWSYQAVWELLDAGLLHRPDGACPVKKAMTRYDFAELIATVLPFMKKTVPPEPPRPPVPPGTVHHFYHLDGYVEPVDTTRLVRLSRNVTKERIAVLQKMLDEFRDELAALGVDVEALRRDMAVLNERIITLEGRGFPDVPMYHWAYSDLRELLSRRAINGYPNGTYRGERAMTRYEFAEALTTVIRSIEQEVKPTGP